MRKQLRQPRPATSAWTSTPPTSWPPTAARPEHDAVDAQRADAVLAGVGDADDRQDLRAEERGGDALHEPRDDEHAGLQARPHAAEASGEQRRARARTSAGGRTGRRAGRR